MNNVPDPLISGKKLPPFQFALEKCKGRVLGGTSAKEDAVEQLPIAKGTAGATMRLAPGGMRELHWHATAAEREFVNEGWVGTTDIQPDGQSETNDFEPGDAWYFPRGQGPLLECLGANPPDVRATTFGKPAALFQKFPKKDVFIADGNAKKEVRIPVGRERRLSSGGRSRQGEPEPIVLSLSLHFVEGAGKD